MGDKQSDRHIFSFILNRSSRGASGDLQRGRTASRSGTHSGFLISATREDSISFMRQMRSVCEKLLWLNGSGVSCSGNLTITSPRIEKFISTWFYVLEKEPIVSDPVFCSCFSHTSALLSNFCRSFHSSLLQLTSFSLNICGTRLI